MEKDGHVGKKARLEVTRVKQEAPAEEPGREVAVAPPRVGVVVTFDKLVLDCPLCSCPLKPPVFQCGARHTACGGCQAKLPGNKCPTCGGVYNEHNHVLDTFVLAAKVRCPYEAHGCRSSVAYCWVAEHQRMCPHAPCACPEPGCGFSGSPPMLQAHLAAQHKWIVVRLALATVYVLHVKASERRRLLVTEGEDGEHVFLLATGQRAGGARSVSMACIRANVAAAPRHRCKVWTLTPVDPESGCKDSLMMEATVRSRAEVTAAAAEEGTVLHVPPSMLDAESKEMVLRVRIDTLRSPSNTIEAAAATTPGS